MGVGPSIIVAGKHSTLKEGMTWDGRCRKRRRNIVLVKIQRGVKLLLTFEEKIFLPRPPIVDFVMQASLYRSSCSPLPRYHLPVRCHDHFLFNNLANYDTMRDKKCWL